MCRKRARRVLFKEARQHLELLVTWLLEVIERHEHEELVGDMVVWQEALDACLDAQLVGHIVDGTPIEPVRALERRHGCVWQQEGLGVLGIHRHFAMVLGNVSQLGDRRLDMIECVVGALIFEALPQTSPKRRIAHVVEQGLVKRIAENVAEKPWYTGMLPCPSWP